MKGIIPRITEQIFESIRASPANLEYLVKVSYMEIYMERIRDLLAREYCLVQFDLQTSRVELDSTSQLRTRTFRFMRTKREEFTSRTCLISTYQTLEKSTRLCVKVVVHEPFPLPVSSPLFVLFAKKC